MLNLPTTQSDPLVWEILGEIGDSVAPTSQSKPIDKLRARHHALAQAIASGMRLSIAAAAYGYSNSYVSILISDPTFSELVAHYQQDKTKAWADLQTRMQALSVEASDEILTRLEDKPEEFTNGTLLELIKLTADRTGHGPKSTTDVNIHVGLSERMQAARERIAQKEKVIEHEN